MKKVLAIIAARMGSTRLPGKSLMPILQKPMLERMVERIQSTASIHQIVIATSELREDDAIEVLAGEIGVDCFRGPANDVLGRIYGAADAFNGDVVVELLGDNPLIHADLIDDVTKFYQGGNCDYVVSVTSEHAHAGASLSRFPIGVRAEVFAMAVLARCAHMAAEPYYREHATSFIHEHPEQFRLGFFEAQGKWREANRPELSFAVNYPDNLTLIRRLFEQCYPANPDFSLIDAIRAFDSDSSLWTLMDGSERS